MATPEEVLAWRGQDLRSRDDEKLGTIEDIYVDAQTRQPEWALVTSGLLGSKQSFVPLREASRSGDAITVPYDKATVKDAPTIDPDGELSQHEEGALHRHYGIQYSATQSDGVVGRSYDEDAADTAGRDVSGPTTDDAMTRSEEELRVGTRERESGRVRLRKYVVEDEVSQTVPVRREEIRIEREPITDANIDDATSGPEISSEEHEVVLHDEELVTEKRVVPKERVRLDKDVEVDERTVSEDVRREEIEIDDGGGRTDRA
jgi:uncharacterized protein (TIGR02271 family)